ncbi:MAG TPA: hypothetical protein PLN86_15255 [Candidatus Hydrogenedentes bacterium]|nr:hypothetical protein [Candidatus Hydrogenedentota bacterium]
MKHLPTITKKRVLTSVPRTAQFDGSSWYEAFLSVNPAEQVMQVLFKGSWGGKI